MSDEVKSANVVHTTSTYASFNEADSMIDGLRTTFWATSGLFPQRFIISLSEMRSISTIEMRSYLVKRITLERSIAKEPRDFQFVAEKELELTDYQHQRENLYIGNMEARHLRFTIKSAYDHVCAIYKIEIKGDENIPDSAVSISEYDAPSKDEGGSKMLDSASSSSDYDAPGKGRGIYTSSSKILDSASSISEYDAPGKGGGSYSDSSKFVDSAASITECSASSKGGRISASPKIVKVKSAPVPWLKNIPHSLPQEELESTIQILDVKSDPLARAEFAPQLKVNTRFMSSSMDNAELKSALPKEEL